MRKLWLALCAVCLLSCAGLAQVKSTVQWKCDKPSIQHSIDVGDKPGHAYAVDQINCTPVTGDINGAKRKSGMGTEFIEINGDKNLYTYQMTGTLKNGVMTGSDKWSMREGAGKLKGAKASGTCKGASNPDQTATWDCSGEYSMAKK